MDSEKIEYEVFLAGSYGNLGPIYQQQENFEEAKLWATKSVELASQLNKKIPNQPSIMEYLSNGFESFACTISLSGFGKKASPVSLCHRFA